MEDGEDWIMRPVIHGMCKYESLKGTELDLEDFARMNAALDVKLENEQRQRKEQENDR